MAADDAAACARGCARRQSPTTIPSTRCDGLWEFSRVGPLTWLTVPRKGTRMRVPEQNWSADNASAHILEKSRHGVRRRDTQVEAFEITHQAKCMLGVGAQRRTFVVTAHLNGHRSPHGRETGTAVLQ